MADSGIESIEDVVGKKYAINLVRSSFDYTTRIYLDQNGISVDDIEFVLLPFSSQEPALVNGEVDIAGLMVPYNEHLIQTYGDEVTQLFNGFDVYGERQVCTIFLNSVWAKHNEDTATKYVTAIAKSINWIEENQEEAKEIVSQYTGVDKEYIPDYFFTENGMVVLEDHQYWVDSLRELEGTLPDWLKVEDFATNKYNELVKE